ncbi:mannitol dehydrogenase family protein [Frondihabitans peucedani]|uniref:mannitol dehydrogenase family protein n=1 Tax=Frondihabitans peucedani TaxID=598626 RepID=UPI0031D72A1A
MRDARERRIVHLGLGAFHRSHQAWFTQHVAEGSGGSGSSSGSASGSAPWGIVAFTGRRPDQADLLSRQDAVYTLLTRAADGATAELVDAIVEAHDGADAPRWRAALADPQTAVVTLTVTEAAYHRAPDGRIDLDDPDVAADAELLRRGAPEACTTAPGRLVDGLRARRDRGSGPVAVVCCDNLTDNGRMTRDMVLSLADEVDAGLGAWILREVSFVASMVDRITPATTDGDRADALALTGLDDPAVVVAEPFAEWVLSGRFPAGRPAWETAGARFVDDLEPYEQRKLWLLNAGHSLLAYLGLHLGHQTVDEAVGDPRCVEPLEQLWDEAAAELPLPADEIAAARAALGERFGNPRIRHRLQQIASDGSVKLPIRVVDPLRRRLARADGARAGAGGVAGSGIGPGAATLLAAWWLHVTGDPSLVADPRSGDFSADLGARDILRLVAPDLAGDDRLVTAVEEARARILRLSPADPATSSPSASSPLDTGVPA